MTKKNIIIIVMVLTVSLLFSTLIIFAEPVYYVATGSESLDVYGYGCDFSGTAGAVVNPNGYWENVTGVKVRTTVYENGIKDTDTSATDTTSPYSVTKSGSCSSSSYSNVWKLVTTDYCRLGSDTSYTESGGFEIEKSN